MSDAYDDHVLDAKDTCANCFLLVRTERVDPTKAGMLKEYQKRFERHPTHTQIGYGPADHISAEKGVFCQCGVEGVYPSDRIWQDRVGLERFKEFIVNAFETLTDKGVSVDKGTFVRVALSNYDDGCSVDTSLSVALDAGLAVEGTRERATA